MSDRNFLVIRFAMRRVVCELGLEVVSACFWFGCRRFGSRHYRRWIAEDVVRQRHPRCCRQGAIRRQTLLIGWAFAVLIASQFGESFLLRLHRACTAVGATQGQGQGVEVARRLAAIPLDGAVHQAQGFGRIVHAAVRQRQQIPGERIGQGHMEIAKFPAAETRHEFDEAHGFAAQRERYQSIMRAACSRL